MLQAGDSITTVDEGRAAPVGTIIITPTGRPLQKIYNGSWAKDGLSGVPFKELFDGTTYPVIWVSGDNDIDFIATFNRPCTR